MPVNDVIKTAGVFFAEMQEKIGKSFFSASECAVIKDHYGSFWYIDSLDVKTGYN
jgi:hypothetical protein